MMRVHPTLQMFSRFNSHPLKKPYRECALYNAIIPSERMDLYIMVAAILELTHNVE
ncbi:hypothetical protein DAPPUDRAFT_270327 [Daphnia pulex]|uniref:Uncharacterized protein n=1 Tax=Daphnia pulex TaxID=6669 RepID=E9I0I5_DAPPU|nr:hypothetical protein DAPPUDRAFT_270327 [Daphnia pulex]|eukprot:EFX62494.1 hypothetical protein DAPPUDRAFT_270327 [Daphnia pulex]